MELALLSLLRGIIGISLLQRFWVPARQVFQLGLALCFLVAIGSTEIAGATKSFLGIALALEIGSAAIVRRRRPAQLFSLAVLVAICLALAYLG